MTDEIVASAGQQRPAICVPSKGPSDWQGLLADPAKQWRSGYSAKTLAHAWEAARGLPAEIARLFDAPAQLLFAVPEHKVPLAGGRRDSQNDLFALIRFGEQISAATIEGKVNEPFDRTVSEWLTSASEGKQQRLRFLCDLLGLGDTPPLHTRYQLLHRTASALIEARRFKTDEAAMIVHSFSPGRIWFDDFQNFTALFGVEAAADEPICVTLSSGQKLRLGWATGDPAFLAA